MGNRVISVICAIAAIAGIVLLGIGYRNYSKEQVATSAVYAELSEKLSVLEAEKNDAEEAVRRIDEGIDVTADVHSTVSLIFRGMSERIYTEIFPTMKEHGIKGVLAMSADNLPGKEGLLSDAQINEFAGEGWILIPEWTEGDGESGVASVDEWIRQYGYAMHGVVLISQESYTPEREALIVGAGYSTVITNLGMTGAGVVYSDEIGEIWDIGAMGYVGNGRNSVIASAIETDGHITFIIGFEEDFEFYDGEKFTSMLTYLDSYDDELEIMDIAAAKAYRIDYDARYKAAVDTAVEQKAVHQAKIEEINGKIDALYKEYGVNSVS